MDNSFVKAPLQVPKLSGFDKSHQNLLTTKVGTITPILVDELIPGSKVNLRLALSGSLPPLASETFMRCSIKTEAFFVPMRLLSGSFENFFTDSPKRYYEDDSAVDVKAALPRIYVTSAANAQAVAAKMGNGSLADYLGFRSGGATALPFVQREGGISLMPFLAYHKIYSDWYRNTLVQRDVFLPPTDYYGSGPSMQGFIAANCPFTYSAADGSVGPRNFNTVGALLLADGVNVLDLRQRNFGLDYFTTAMPQPQQGDPAKVSFNTNAATGEFSIAALRASNSLQQFKDRNGLLGDFYVDHLRGRYGVRPSDAIAQRAILLGSGEFEVYSKGVYQTSNTAGEDTNNPFANTVGARFGSAYASGSDFFVNLEATEPGYLFVMATLVPRVTYSSGIDPMLLRYTRDGSIGEMANPILQNVGPEPIYSYELTGSPDSHIFGYTDRYASFKTKQDTLHGLLRDGQSLQSFALQRSFRSTDTVQISSDFLQIPTNYLDQVASVSGSISEYGCWIDCFFDYKVAMPLSKYSLPSLQDPTYEHGKVVVVDKGGSKL